MSSAGKGFKRSEKGTKFLLDKSTRNAAEQGSEGREKREES